MKFWGMILSRITGIAVLGVLVVPLKVFAQNSLCSGEIYCSCTGKVYKSGEAAICTSECIASLGCFTGICMPLPGRPPVDDPSDKTAWKEQETGETYSEKEAQSIAFPNLKCYRVIAERDKSYNCIASTSGDSFWVWNEVDEYYGNNDKVPDVEDFDSYYSYGGYTVSANCQIETGKHKIALYGEQISSNGTIQPTHGASQSEFQGAGGGWWESKEGEQKKVLHQLEDIGGERYGKVIKCYEKVL